MSQQSQTEKVGEENGAKKEKDGGLATWIRGIRDRVAKSTLLKDSGWRDALIALLFASTLVFPLTGFSLFPQGVNQMYLSVASDEEYYASIVHEVSEGRLLRRNAYLYEEKQGTLGIYTWNGVVLGTLFRFLPIGIAWFVLFCKWAGVLISFILLTKLSRSIFPASSHPVWAYVAAAGFFTLPPFISRDIFSSLWNALHLRGIWVEGLGSVRFDNPVITDVLLLGWMYLFTRFLERPRRSLAIALGLLLGSMAWFYVYFWMFATVVLGLAWLFFLWRRVKSSVASTTIALMVSFVIAIPYTLLVKWQIAHATTTIFELQSIPRVLLISYAVAAVYTLFFGIKAWQVYTGRRAWSFGDAVVATFVLGSFLVENQHLITGSTLMPLHFYFAIDLPLAGWVGGLLIREVAIMIAPRVEKVMAIGALIGLTWLGLGVQIATIGNVRNDFVDRQRLMPAFEWIKQHAYPFVVYADNRAAEIIPMYTDADVYYAPHASLFESTPQARRELAWFVSKRLSGLTNPDEVPSAFIHDRQDIGLFVFNGHYWRDRCGSYGCFPDAYLQDLIKKYRAFLSQDFSRTWRTYRIDAVLWDEKREPSWQLGQYPFLEQVWKGDGVSIWRWRSSP